MQIRMRDDIGREVFFGAAPRRVVSLVPSETDNLFALGLGECVVGRTDYCVEPAGRVDAIPTVGGTKGSDVDAILELGPDLVLANKEENSRPVLEKLAQRGVRVFVSFPCGVRDGVAHLARLARIFRVEKQPAVRDRIKAAYELTRAEPPAATRRVFAPIWMDPLMTLSQGTYAHDVLAWVGAENVFGDRQRQYPLKADLGDAEPMTAEQVGDRDTRYPRITLDEVREAAPDLILLTDEPHPFSESDAAVFRECVPGADIHFVSGKDLFWPGARTVDAIEGLRALAGS